MVVWGGVSVEFLCALRGKRGERDIGTGALPPVVRPGAGCLCPPLVALLLCTENTHPSTTLPPRAPSILLFFFLLLLGSLGTGVAKEEKERRRSFNQGDALRSCHPRPCDGFTLVAVLQLRFSSPLPVGRGGGNTNNKAGRPDTHRCMFFLLRPSTLVPPHRLPVVGCGVVVGKRKRGNARRMKSVLPQGTASSSLERNGCTDALMRSVDVRRFRRERKRYP